MTKTIHVRLRCGRHKCLRWFGNAAILSAMLLTSPALAEQFTPVDADYVHRDESHARFEALPEWPADWTSPVNYAEGTAHIWVDVKSRPQTTRPVRLTTCLTQKGAYCCAGNVEVREPGEYTLVKPIPDFWCHNTVDWSIGLRRIALIAKDVAFTNIDAGNDFEGSLSDYYPMEIDFRVTIVSKGGTYTAPEDEAPAEPGDGSEDDEDTPPTIPEEATEELSGSEDGAPSDPASAAPDASESVEGDGDATGGCRVSSAEQPRASTWYFMISGCVFILLSSGHRRSRHLP